MVKEMLRPGVARHYRNAFFLIGAFLVSTVFGVPAAAQNSLDPGSLSASVPTISFQLDWKVADPQWYQITVDQNGQASYESRPRTADNQPAAEPYTLHFIMSQPTRIRIFQIANALHDFQGNFETRA
ncbi:MAG TPA: hypothetical protein VFU86_14190, partial [Terriglobales bacterium]|nr:hypothetical protein [Terriglobales bacterium]